jgi:uncharacterized protein YjbJ (UPF0337 family)
MWNKNERDGNVDQAKGKLKQAIATVTADDDLKAEGKADESIGKAEEAFGNATHKVGDAIKKFGDAVKK